MLEKKARSADGETLEGGVSSERQWKDWRLNNVFRVAKSLSWRAYIIVEMCFIMPAGVYASVLSLYDYVHLHTTSVIVSILTI